MTPDELKKMLGMKPSTKLAKVQEIQDSIVYDVQDGSKLRPSESVFEFDDWELEQGERLTKKMGWDRYSYTVADCFAAAFRQYPEIVGDTGDQVTQEFFAALIESPDFKVLHESTRANLLASDMAAVEFANQWSKLVEKDKEHQEQRSNGVRSKDPQAEEDARKIACLNAVNRAIKAATEDVEEMEDVQRAIGLEPNQHGAADLERAQQIFNKVKNSAQLRRICELAGKYRRAAQAKQRQKTMHGYDDMIGVELSGDIARLLPLELAQLADEDFEMDAMRRLVEKQSMSRKYQGVEKQAKGPIVVCVDESGSMSGEPLAQAKAFALSMYWIAKHQKRDCWLVSFAAGPEMHSVKLYPGRASDNLLNWLGHNFNGGTTMDVPLVQVPQQWNTFKPNADMIIITDAQVLVPASMKEGFLKFKADKKVKLTTIVIGAEAGDMRAVSDETFHVSGIAVDNEAVSKCMSI